MNMAWVQVWGRVHFPSPWFSSTSWARHYMLPGWSIWALIWFGRWPVTWERQSTIDIFQAASVYAIKNNGPGYDRLRAIKPALKSKIAWRRGFDGIFAWRWFHLTRPWNHRKFRKTVMTSPMWSRYSGIMVKKQGFRPLLLSFLSLIIVSNGLKPWKRDKNLLLLLNI